MSTVTETSPPASLDSATLAVEGMTCASCVAHVEKATQKVPGVASTEVNLVRGRATVRFDRSRTNPQAIALAVSASGYDAKPISETENPSDAEAERLTRQASHARSWLIRAIVGIALWLPLEATHWAMKLFGSGTHHAEMSGMAPIPADQTAMGWAAAILSTAAVIFVGWPFYVSAAKALRARTSNMDTLISLGAGVAYLYSLITFVGGLAGWWNPPTEDRLYFMEAGGLLALISLGHWLEARARASAGSAIRALLELSPASALLVADNGEPREVAVSTLEVGDRVLVRPGDRVPVDGRVVDGRSNVDESMISGEPIPVVRGAGDTVIGGTINRDGRLTVRVTKIGSATALSQIVSLVEKAQADKPPVQRLADRVAAVFVPSVLLVAAITGIGWYAWGAGHHWPIAQTLAQVARTVCSVLIIACPCALGLAVPMAVMVGAGRGARQGILIRDIDALQNAERIDTIVFDKTGTLTTGRPTVAEIVPMGEPSPQELLRLAASAEQFSEHPLAKALVAHARQQQLKLSEPTSFRNEPGMGVVAELGDSTLLVGSAALLKEKGTVELPPGWAGTWVYVAREDQGLLGVLGAIRFDDELKPDSAAALSVLHAMGLRTHLLTGDSQSAAESVARAAGISQVRAGVRPAEKAEYIREIQGAASSTAGQSRVVRHFVAMVGDGINDGPALATADLGIAIGSGSDVAKEAGGIVLVGGSLSGVTTAIRLSRTTMRKIRQNLFLAFIYNVLAIPLAAFGLLNPLVAAAAMALSDVTVIGNALLLRREKID